MRELDQRFETKCKIVEVRWEPESELVQKYQVFGTPSLLIFSQGKLINRYSGTIDARDFLGDRHFETIKQDDFFGNDHPQKKSDGEE